MNVKRLSRKQILNQARQIANSSGASTQFIDAIGELVDENKNKKDDTSKEVCNALSLCVAIIRNQFIMLKKENDEIQDLEQRIENLLSDGKTIDALENDLSITTEALANLRDTAAEALAYGNMTDLKYALVASNKIEPECDHTPFKSDRTDGYLLSIIGTH